jgi:hypothetical protein
MGIIPMIYSVKARFRENKMPEFYHKLTDGTILSQEPDGQEIADSMKRATITGPGTIQWTETCYCSPPLKHERQTVYDKYLFDLETMPTDGHKQYAGESFMGHLKSLQE